jgi:hypothetical protein
MFYAAHALRQFYKLQVIEVIVTSNLNKDDTIVKPENTSVTSILFKLLI